MVCPTRAGPHARQASALPSVSPRAAARCLTPKARRRLTPRTSNAGTQGHLQWLDPSCTSRVPGPYGHPQCLAPRATAIACLGAGPQGPACSVPDPKCALAPSPLHVRSCTHSSLTHLPPSFLLKPCPLISLLSRFLLALSHVPTQPPVLDPDAKVDKEGAAKDGRDQQEGGAAGTKA